MNLIYYTLLHVLNCTFFKKTNLEVVIKKHYYLSNINQKHIYLTEENDKDEGVMGEIGLEGILNNF